MNDVANPSTVLDDVEAHSPTEIRRSVLNIVREAVGADAAVFSRYFISEDGSYSTSVEAVGASEFTDAVDRYCERRNDYETIWDPQYPPKESEQKFTVIDYTDETLAERSDIEALRNVYEEADVVAEALALLYDGPHFLGWLAVYRLEDGTFDDNDIEQLDGLVESAANALAEAVEREIELLGERPARILINPEVSEVECATGNAYEWLTEIRKAELLDRIAELDLATSFPVKLFVDGFPVWVTQMTGELGMRLLATVEYAESPEKKPDAVLTPRQREVVGYAAAGATNREIAETLDITPDTVSDHLSEAYDRLGVANRVELALILTQGAK